MSDNGAYMKKVLLQVEDLNAVIEKIKSEDFVDKDNIYLLGSKHLVNLFKARRDLRNTLLLFLGLVGLLHGKVLFH